AVNSLQRYIFTKEEEDFQTFKDFLKVPLGDHWGRLELEKPPGERDEKKMYEGFLQGRNHYDDIGGMIRVLTRFQANPYIAEAVQKWIEADALIFSLMELGDEIHAHMQTGNYSQKYLLSAVQDIHALNTKLTRVEDRFS